jgi:AcrR family transcriptional regulator
MSHKEDLLAGAVACLREKGYAQTTARDIVAASGTNLASIGYHYGSTKALLNAAVLKALDDFGEQMAQAMQTDAVAGQTTLERFERFWTQVIDSFRTSRQVWLATFDIFTVAQRDPQVRAVVADGIEDARAFWAEALYGVDPADRQQARAVGSLHQALVSGVLVQWLIDPERAPSPADLAAAMGAIADQVDADTPAAWPAPDTGPPCA